MRSDLFEKLELTISVVGLSGPSEHKGLTGVGKSYLCHKLTQPDRYLKKYDSSISQVDFYGPVLNESHWLFWGTVNQNINDKTYKINVIEQTVFVDDTNYVPFVSNEPRNYMERCINCNIGIRKMKFQGNYQGNNAFNEYICPNEETIVIDAFIIVYDVSLVVKRDISYQTNFFKKLFDSLITTKRPIVVIATKYDDYHEKSYQEFVQLVDKKPYCKYPIIETSSTQDINIDCIFPLIVNLINASTPFKNLNNKNKSVLYKEGILQQKKNINNLEQQLKSLVVETLNHQLFIKWEASKSSKTFIKFINKIGMDNCKSIFENMQSERISKQRQLNLNYMKQIFNELLDKFSYMFQNNNTSLDVLVNQFRSNSDFMVHFQEYSYPIEYFPDIDSSDHCISFDNSVKLPIYLLNADHPDNFLQLIQQYSEFIQIYQKCLPHMLSQWIINYKKSMDAFKADLESSTLYNLDGVIDQLYNQFRKRCEPWVTRKFIESLHEHPQVFWSHKLLRNKVILFPEHSCYLNNNEYLVNSRQLLSQSISEINGNICFDLLPINQSDQQNNPESIQLRERCIRQYLEFLMSDDINECIFDKLSINSSNIISHTLEDSFLEHYGCCRNQLEAVLQQSTLPRISLEHLDLDKSVIPHIIFVNLQQTSTHLVNDDFLLNIQHIWNEEINNNNNKHGFCCVHQTKYELQFVQSLDNIQLIDALSTNNDKNNHHSCLGNHAVCQQYVIVNIVVCDSTNIDQNITAIHSINHNTQSSHTTPMDLLHFIVCAKSSSHDSNNNSQTNYLTLPQHPSDLYITNRNNNNCLNSNSKRKHESNKCNLNGLDNVILVNESSNTARDIVSHILQLLFSVDLWAVGFCGGYSSSDDIGSQTTQSDSSHSAIVTSLVQYILQSLDNLVSTKSIVQLIGFGLNHTAITISCKYRHCLEINSWLDYDASRRYYMWSGRTIIGKYLRITFVTYHQALKQLVFNSFGGGGSAISLGSMPDGLLLLSSLERPASIQTLGSIKQFIPSTTATTTEAFMIAVDTSRDGTPPCASITKSVLDNMNNNFNIVCDICHCFDAQFNCRDQLCAFINKIIINDKSLPVNSSTYSTIKSDSISVTFSSDDPNSRLCKMCCEACRKMGLSGSSLFPKSIIKDSSSSDIKSIVYDMVLGNTNEEMYKPLLQSEYHFDLVQDLSYKFTIVRCQEWEDDVDDQGLPMGISKVVRTRGRSHSGPDLRSEIDSANLRQHCDCCGTTIKQYCPHISNRHTNITPDLNSSTEHRNCSSSNLRSRNSFNQKPSSTAKKKPSIIQGFFNNYLKHSDINNNSSNITPSNYTNKTPKITKTKL